MRRTRETLGRELLVFGGILIWLPAVSLMVLYGPLSLAVGVLYAVATAAVLLALQRRRRVGLTLGGAFAGGCVIGALMSLEQLWRTGAKDLLLAAMALVLGGAGTVLACLVRTANHGSLAGAEERPTRARGVGVRRD